MNSFHLILSRIRNANKKTRSEENPKRHSPKQIFNKLINKEEELVFDLEKDFKNNQLRFLIKLFSELGSSIVMFALFVIIGFLYGLDSFIFLTFVYLFQLFLIELIKLVFKRKRPKTFNNASFLFGIKSSSGSFPSGHTSNVYSAALSISNLFRTNIYLTATLFILAGFVACSRIFLGKHYVLDVVGGAFLGMIFTLIAIWIYTILFTTIFG